MKKLICLTLALLLVMGAATTALADRKYDSALLAQVDLTSSQLTASSDSRVLTCVMALLIYVELDIYDNIFSEIDYFGTAKVADWGVTVDVYLPTRDGGYYNLFLMPVTDKVEDYGKTYTVSTLQTYCDVPMSEVTSVTLEVLNSDSN